MIATAPVLISAEEFLRLPADESVEPMLIRGELREHPTPYRNRFHGEATACISAELVAWIRSLRTRPGKILNRDAGFRLAGNPATVFGIDVAYVSAETIAATPANSAIVHGAPILAVEVLSPNDSTQDIDEKVELLLDAGTAVVWIVDTHFRTVRIYTPDAPPRMVAADAELAAEPHLPGFRVPVSRLFE